MNHPQFEISTEASLIASTRPTSRIVEITLTAPEARTERTRIPLNLALVIDRSGSMADGKLEQAKNAVAEILALMQPSDSVTIVDFDDRVTLTAGTDSVTPAAREELVQAVQRLEPRGSTDLGSGWLMGCECVARLQARNRINRTLLLTDGQANQGMTSVDELSGHAAALFERGIATSTFGIGEDFNEYLLEAMANKGGGNYYFIDSHQALPKILMTEFKDLAAVTLKNVVLDLAFPSDVNVELLGDWRSDLDDNHLRIFLSDLSANRKVTLFLKLLTPPGSGQVVMTGLVHGQDEENKPFQVSCELTLQYASVDKVALAEASRNEALVSRFATVMVGQISNQALQLERDGKRQEAGKIMERMMLDYSDHLPAATRQRYEQISHEISLGLNEMSRKSFQMDAYQLKKHRHQDQQDDKDQH